jgi:hypothetical protein
MTKREQAVLSLAIEFSRLADEAALLRSMARHLRCSVADPGSPEDRPVPPCWRVGDDIEIGWCENCRKSNEFIQQRKQVVKKRAAAGLRLRRAVRRLQENRQ